MPPLYNAYEAKILDVLHSKLCKEKLVFLFVFLFLVNLRSHLATSFIKTKKYV